MERAKELGIGTVPEDDTINIRQELERYSYYWKWFVASVLVALAVAYTYVRYSTPEYVVATTILVNDEDNRNVLSELSAFEDLGMLNHYASSIDNEIELLKSRSLLEKVLKKHQFNVQYFREGRIKSTELFKNSSNIGVTFFTEEAVLFALDTTFTIQVLSPTTIELRNSEDTSVGTYRLGERIPTSYGAITVTPQANRQVKEGDVLRIALTPMEQVVTAYKSKITVQPVNKNASVLQISLQDPVKEKAAFLVNALVNAYNEATVKDKSKVAVNTDTFIEQRLEKITEELTKVELNVQEFKSDNKLIDIATEANLSLTQESEVSKEIVQTTTQVTLVDYLLAYLDRSEHKLIPENLGLTDAAVNASTSHYNTLLLERDRLLQSTSEAHPVVINLNAQLTELQATIRASLTNAKKALQLSLEALEQQEALFNSKIAKAPKQERVYRSIMRQQEIIESLYLYLLKKREENAIALAGTLPNSKVIDEAYGTNVPVTPKKKMIYLAALVIGVLVPFVVLYLLFLLDTKVHSRKEVEALLSLPMVGEIPKSTEKQKVVVSNQDKSSIAEAFRMVRTNIRFMFRGQQGSQAIFVTSTEAGEGKTFVAINLASVMALSNKKVLLVAADIRKPRVSKYLEVTEKEQGLTDYLADEQLSIQQVISHSDTYHFDVIHTGTVPPNPAELLMNNRFEEVMRYGKEHYDYVIVDTSPVSLVTDTLLIAHTADLVVYMIRANYLDKRMLDIPKNLANEQRLPNMTLLLNDVDLEKGYGYGYAYGYAYGAKRKKWYQTLFS